MGELNLNNAAVSDLANAVEDYSVDAANTDGASGEGETRWTNDRWSQQYGYFKQIAELNACINAKATWTVGKGVIAGKEEQPDLNTELTIKSIVGFGKDTFNTILENMIRTYYIGGDAFAEIIRNEKRDLINLKVLDPSSIVIVAGENGLIKRYEQTTKAKGGKNIKFKPDEIFHLPRNRVADQIHGVSVIDAVESIILARNESITDYKQMMHRYMKPRYIFHLDTDDEDKISAFKTKMDTAYADGENLYIPKDAVVPEQMSIAPNSTLDPKSWIEQQ
jgi:hypothetical protein